MVGTAGVCHPSECAGDRVRPDNLLDWHLLQPYAACHLHHQILFYLLYQKGHFFSPYYMFIYKKRIKVGHRDSDVLLLIPRSH